MSSILEEFAYGNINPNELSFSQNSEYGKAVKVRSDCEETLLKALNESEKELYELFSKTERAVTVLDNAERSHNS